MSRAQPKNPLHGVTLEAMLKLLVARHGWEGLAARIDVRCFSIDPSLSSSLKFLRRTEWARKKVEALYLEGLGTEEAGTAEAGTAEPGSERRGDAER